MEWLISSNLTGQKLRGIVVAEWRGDVVSQRVKIAIIDLGTIVDWRNECDR